MAEYQLPKNEDSSARFVQKYELTWYGQHQWIEQRLACRYGRRFTVGEQHRSIERLVLRVADRWHRP